MKLEKRLGLTERFGLSVSLSKREKEMVDELKRSPHCVNMSEFVREAIKKLYEQKQSLQRK